MKLYLSGIMCCLIFFISTAMVHAQFMNKPDSAHTAVLLKAGKQQLIKQQFTISNSDQWYSKDKADHFLVSALLTASCLHLTNNYSSEKTATISITLPLTIGIGKEIWDGFKPNHVASMKDVVADVVGIAIGYILFN